jgi:hypothetical protein
MYIYIYIYMWTLDTEHFTPTNIYIYMLQVVVHIGDNEGACMARVPLPELGIAPFAHGHIRHYVCYHDVEVTVQL